MKNSRWNSLTGLLYRFGISVLVSLLSWACSDMSAPAHVLEIKLHPPKEIQHSPSRLQRWKNLMSYTLHWKEGQRELWVDPVASDETGLLLPPVLNLDNLHRYTLLVKAWYSHEGISSRIIAKGTIRMTREIADLEVQLRLCVPVRSWDEEKTREPLDAPDRVRLPQKAP